jgi:hypothetical protein
MLFFLRQRTTRYKPLYPAPKPADQKYLREVARLQHIEGTRLALEHDLKTSQKPIESYNRLRTRQNEAIRMAQQKNMPIKDQIEAAHSIVGNITYEDFIKARKKTDSIKSEIHKATIEEHRVRTKVEALTPYQPKVSTLGGTIFRLLVLAMVVCWVGAVLFE